MLLNLWCYTLKMPFRVVQRMPLLMSCHLGLGLRQGHIVLYRGPPQIGRLCPFWLLCSWIAEHYLKATGICSLQCTQYLSFCRSLNQAAALRTADRHLLMWRGRDWLDHAASSCIHSGTGWNLPEVSSHSCIFLTFSSIYWHIRHVFTFSPAKSLRFVGGYRYCWGLTPN